MDKRLHADSNKKMAQGSTAPKHRGTRKRRTVIPTRIIDESPESRAWCATSTSYLGATAAAELIAPSRRHHLSSNEYRQSRACRESPFVAAHVGVVGAGAWSRVLS